MSQKHAPKSDLPSRVSSAALVLTVVSFVLALAVIGVGSLFR